MYSPVLSVPTPSVSAWVAETDPKYASAWLASLPLANSAESAREIYQALYTVNRLDLRLTDRLELMTLYDDAVATVCLGLQSHLMHESPPLGPKKRQLAEFIRRLHIEMAYGYKYCLRDLSRVRLTLRRKARSALCIERALYHSSEVLLRSYVVYLPYPGGVWRETHELYRLSESLGITDGTLDVDTKDRVPTTTINDRYVQTVLLGLTNPYQLPHGAAQQVRAFLVRWGGQVAIVPQVVRSDTAGCFLIDLGADAPPVPLAKNSSRPAENTRILDARVLLQTIQSFVVRLERGETIEDLSLGVDCLDSTCIDLLRRMIRAWGESARRRYARRQDSSSVFLCVGLGLAHYHINGQRPFEAYAQTLNSGQGPHHGADPGDVAFIELDDVSQDEPDTTPVTSPSTQPLTESRRVNRWRLRDIGPQGMSLTRYGEETPPIRVGDVVGVQQPTDLGRWRVAVVRWIKTPEANGVEVGIEILAAGVTPALVQRYEKDGKDTNPRQALLLPAAEVTKRPPTLLLPRGECSVGDVIEVRDEESAPRHVRILRLIERTGSFEQIVYAEITAPTLHRG
jgi:hypothetical protein